MSTADHQRRPDHRVVTVDELLAPRLTRRERHLGEIMRTVRSGDRTRASMLGQEHLAEFPDDAPFVRVLLWVDSTAN